MLPDPTAAITVTYHMDSNAPNGAPIRLTSEVMKTYDTMDELLGDFQSFDIPDRLISKVLLTADQSCEYAEETLRLRLVGLHTEEKDLNLVVTPGRVLKARFI